MKNLKFGVGIMALAASQAAAGAVTEVVPVASPQSPSVTDAIADIVVTAQRRSESLQKTSLAIAVVQPAQLAVAGITSGLQLTTVLPSLQVANSGPAATVYVRGVGSFASTAGQSPAVPFYIDGVYVARSQSVPSEFYDVERLEVLKGPQGTLYGRNASGGAINILTKRPELGVLGGHFDLEIGSYGDQTGEIAVNVPVGQTLAFRASAQITDKGGYTSERAGDDIHQSARLKALWQPTSDVSLLLNGSWGHIGGLGPAQVAFNRDIPGWYPWLDGTDPRSVAYLITHPGGQFSPPFVNGPGPNSLRQDLSFYNISGQLDWDIGNVRLTVLPSYRYSTMQYASAFGVLYNNGYEIGDPAFGGSTALGTASIPPSPETSKATAVEARLSGNSNTLKWVAGLYYFNEDQYQQYTIDGGWNSHVGDTTTFGTRSYAAFGQATLSVTDQIRLIGGLRYTSDHRESAGNEYVLSQSAFNPASPVPPAAIPCTGFGSTAGNGRPDIVFAVPKQSICLVDHQAGARTYHNVSWKAGFEADVFNDSLFYATASRGFKAGGYNTQSIPGQPGVALQFLPETLTSYDVGLKSRLMGNKLQLNVSGFYWDYKGHQEPKISFTNAGILNLIYFNAGGTHIYGGDVEIVAKPWLGGLINASVEYAHSKYTSFSYDIPTFTAGGVGCPKTITAPGTTTVNCAGYEALKTPQWSGNLGVTQTVDLSRGKLILNGSVSFASARWLGTNFIPIERAKAYGVLDASATYAAPGGHWSVTGFVRNISNGVVYTQVQNNPFSSIEIGTVNAPRTFGARASVNF